MSYLRYLCLFAHIGVQHTLCFCFVFLRLVYPMLPVSTSCVPNVTSFSGLCCVFVLFFFVLCTQCYQFLRLVYPMLPVSLDCLFSIAPSVFSIDLLFSTCRLSFVRQLNYPTQAIFLPKMFIIFMYVLWN